MRVTRRFGIVVVLAASILMLSALLTGCGQKMDYTDQGRSYARDSLADLFSTVEEPAFLGRPTADAADLRQSQLASLRSKGEDASTLADMLTKQFPEESRSVPYYAESATVDGTAAWIVLEAWGSEGETLERLRLWAFDRETGNVLYSSARN